MSDNKTTSMQAQTDSGLNAGAESDFEEVHWLDWPALAIFTALIIVVFIQFFTRYALNDSWAWTEEIARFLLVGLVFSGSLSVVYRGEHIFLEVVHRLVPRENSKPLALFSEGLGFFYYLTLGVIAFMLMTETDQNLISIAVPKAWVYGFIAATLVLSAWFSVLRFKSLWQKTSEQIYAELDSKIGEDS